MKPIIICVSMAILFGLMGCGPQGVSDQQLATDIQAKIYADPTARTANVKVAVSNGVVTLTGDAPSSDIALDVANIASGTAGTRSVTNQLQIAPTAATGSTLPPSSNLAQNAPPPVERTERKDRRPDDDRDHPRRDETPAAPLSVTVPAGTDIGVQMIDGINSKTNTAGQTFRASLSSPVVVNGETVLPAGSDATILLASAKEAARIRGSAALEVRLIKIMHAGQTYDVDTNVHEDVGKGRGKQTIVRSGIGAAAGAVIGAIAGGGKGAAIGSLAGGGAGAGFQLATHGQQVSIPSETRLTFRLQSPVVVNVR